jgi:hypothetical protein
MTCDDYLKDPEAGASHLETCAECAAIAHSLGAGVAPQSRAIDLDDLPMASWESASHRTWPLVAAGTLSVLILAVVLFLAAGTSPLRGIARAFGSTVPSLDLMVNLSELAGGALHNAPPVWHIAIGVSFVVINAVLLLLLRRAPRGIDV